MIEYENLGKLNQPFFEELEESFKATLNSGWYVLGNNVVNFEQEFADYLGIKYCIGVGNGLDAMTLSLMALELPKDSEVIVPSNTYIATILSICHAGLKPVLVEPDPRTYNICPSKIEQAITDKTKAVMVVHLYGKPCEMDAIKQICNGRDLYLLEDCAQSHGARYKNQHTGTFGNFGCFSFYPTKNLGALGDGGAVVTNDEKLADKIRYLRNYGSNIKYHNKYVGFNSRLDEIQAGFLRVKLRNLEQLVSHKRTLARIYDNFLTDKVIKPVIQESVLDAFHIYNILTNQRDELQKYLLEKGIRTEIHYPIPPHQQVAMKNIIDENIDYPISTYIHEQTLSLPISFIHDENDIKHVVDVINGFFDR